MAFLGEEMRDMPLLRNVAKMCTKRDFYALVELEPLHVAVLSGKEEAFCKCLENGADAQATTVTKLNGAATGFSPVQIEAIPLHLAAISGSEPAMPLLLERYIKEAPEKLSAKLLVEVGSWLHIEVPLVILARISGGNDTVQLLFDSGFSVRIVVSSTTTWAMR